ncbi:hypothetical protein K227x_62730 [Rubripirellula lacrimiformis]|uniref:Uncharacterized protein n=1 Tax=Rubripirellula lacrimiformis TaxID=1930273 RepID=A0A517NL35_9BACT|nr:hypothetical protein [Rubripirellula lacrimiformis]QDT07844.1 hypothetical protein K227x_62730 [Rubripirellula lacrimiformis]
MVWITRFTLLAYLVGGWLLPASHFHAHNVVASQGVVLCGGHHHSSDASHDHEHAHDSLASDSIAGDGSSADDGSPSDVAGHRGCDRLADSANPSANPAGCGDKHLDGQSGHIGSRGISDHCHSGLCVVCVAQTMVSIVVVHDDVTTRLAPPLPCPAFTQRSLYLSPLCGADSSRGPPKMA